jgi:osmotically-inducible protein OsmY
MQVRGDLARVERAGSMGNIMVVTTTKSDAELDREVTKELEWDPRVDSNALAVSVKNGVVTLAGFVDNYAKKLAARDAAHAVSGVLDVADQIQVKPVETARTDAEIAQAVRSALVWDVFVPDQRIQSTVSNGWVTLEGEVDFSYERDDTVRAVGRLAGVRGVTNLISIKPSHVDAAQVRQAIEGALSRRARREAKAINIKVDRSTVRLSGIVQSRAEKTAIERVALDTPGVAKVENAIEINPNA